MLAVRRPHCSTFGSLAKLCPKRSAKLGQGSPRNTMPLRRAWQPAKGPACLAVCHAASSGAALPVVGHRPEEARIGRYPVVGTYYDYRWTDLGLGRLELPPISQRRHESFMSLCHDVGTHSQADRLLASQSPECFHVVLTGRLFIGVAAPVPSEKNRLQGNRYIRQSFAGPERGAPDGWLGILPIRGKPPRFYLKSLSSKGRRPCWSSFIASQLRHTHECT
jgi:hypothetical protein